MPGRKDPGAHTVYMACPRGIWEVLEGLRRKRQEDEGGMVALGSVIVGLLRSHPTLKKALLQHHRERSPAPEQP